MIFSCYTKKFVFFSYNRCVNQNADLFIDIIYFRFDKLITNQEMFEFFLISRNKKPNRIITAKSKWPFLNNVERHRGLVYQENNKSLYYNFDLLDKIGNEEMLKFKKENAQKDKTKVKNQPFELDDIFYVLDENDKYHYFDSSSNKWVYTEVFPLNSTKQTNVSNDKQELPSALYATESSPTILDNDNIFPNKNDCELNCQSNDSNTKQNETIVEQNINLNPIVIEESKNKNDFSNESNLIVDKNEPQPQKQKLFKRFFAKNTNENQINNQQPQNNNNAINSNQKTEQLNIQNKQQPQKIKRRFNIPFQHTDGIYYVVNPNREYFMHDVNKNEWVKIHKFPYDKLFEDKYKLKQEQPISLEVKNGEQNNTNQQNIIANNSTPIVSIEPNISKENALDSIDAPQVQNQAKPIVMNDNKPINNELNELPQKRTLTRIIKKTLKPPLDNEQSGVVANPKISNQTSNISLDHKINEPFEHEGIFYVLDTNKNYSMFDEKQNKWVRIDSFPYKKEINASYGNEPLDNNKVNDDVNNQTKSTIKELETKDNKEHERMNHKINEPFEHEGIFYVLDTNKNYSMFDEEQNKWVRIDSFPYKKNDNAENQSSENNDNDIDWANNLGVPYGSSTELGVVDIDNITYIYEGNNTPSLNNVSFKIKRGSFHVFAGENGAGKSTMIKVMLGHISGYEGTISINKKNVLDFPSVKRLLSYVEDVSIFPSFFTTYQYLYEIGRLMGTSPATTKSKIIYFLKQFQIPEVKNKNPNKLSMGQKKKVLLIRSLLEKSKLLILDEPAANLDPTTKIQIFDLLKGLQKQGFTIFISTHLLDDIKNYATDLTLISKGNIIYSGPVSSSEFERISKEFFTERSKEINSSEVISSIINL